MQTKCSGNTQYGQAVGGQEDMEAVCEKISCESDID